MNRRESLRLLGFLAAGTAVIGSQSCDSKGPNGKASTAAATPTDQLPGIQDFEYERTKTLYEERYFDEHEMATIALLADIIIPEDDSSPSATAVGVPAFIEFIVKDIPSHKLPMRGGLKWLDVLAQKKYGHAFVHCKAEQQIALVDLIAYPSKALPEHTQGVTFFNRMRDLTASGYYTSKEGIADLGYVGNRPGVWNGVPDDILKEHGFIS